MLVCLITYNYYKEKAMPKAKPEEAEKKPTIKQPNIVIKKKGRKLTPNVATRYACPPTGTAGDLCCDHLVVSCSAADTTLTVVFKSSVIK
jgi:hypothetical protein